MMHDFYRKIARIIAKEHKEKLFDYIIHSMDDDGGFLRTRYCYWDKELPNKKSGKDINTVLVSLRSPFDFSASSNYYDDENVRTGIGTVLKMQIFYFDLSNEECFRNMARWSARVGFPYPIKIDMLNETFEVLERIDERWPKI